MNSLTNNVLLYARHVYGIQMLYRNRAAYLRTEDDIYRIDIRLAHEGIFRFYSSTFPIMITDTNFARGIFRTAVCKTYRDINKVPTCEDWKKFVNDAYAYAASLES